MREAYRLTRKDGAPGIDGVTAAEYAQSLEANLWDLLERIKSGRYQAPPVRRAYIPKGDGASPAPRPSDAGFIFHLTQFELGNDAVFERRSQPIRAVNDPPLR